MIRRESFEKVKKTNNFEFIYMDTNEKDKLLIYGINNYQDQNRKRASLFLNDSQLEKEIIVDVVQNSMKNRNEWKDIKTYRLWDQELYNVDLEDK
jgi:23S rRNA G2069 N7-methylase RlmK/C1962 C5-methylase RlmI